MHYISATYDPADDKIRLSASSRLDAETYARVKAAGYGWAPKQEVFYAIWSPCREDLAIELAGDIGDEDTTLVDRAEQRAERFEEYSDKRLSEAHQAREAVARISDGIPMGQPILIGHHSERHARKDAERIENGMRKAVKMWETSQYWESRAAGAIRNAKYKELPAVRARRIKGLESELRKQEGHIKHAEIAIKMWNACAAIADPDAQLKSAIALSNTHGVYMPHKEGDKPDFDQSPRSWEALTNHYPSLYAPRTVGEVLEVAARVYPASIAQHNRWADHYRNRLTYERAMLADGGGLAAEKFDIEVGGQVQRRGEWYIVTGLNKRNGALLSVSVIGHWAGTIQAEDIQGYKAAPEGAAEKVKAATKLPPLCNFPGEGFRECTKAELKSRYSYIRVFPATETHGAYRAYCRIKGGPGLDCHNAVQVFQTDVKVKPAPVVAAEPRPELPAREPAEHGRPAYRAPEKTEFDSIKETLKAGVQVVSAPQLFPTPAALAARMVALSGLKAGETVLEPSAGTGAIVRAVIEAVDTEIVGYETNLDLVSHLTRTFPSYKLQARCCDFLTVTEGQGQFPIVLMNPPFANADDIKHIQHARTFLKPGGTLVAICANGPRQRAALMDMADHWEDLPAGTFTESGTNVNAALLVIRCGGGR